MIKKYRPNIIFFFGVVIVAMIMAAFYDLQIDKALNNPENIFAIWFRNTGEMPGRLICPLAGTVLFYTYKNKLQQIAGLIIAMGGSAYFGYYFSKYFFVEHEMIFGLVFGIGFGLVCPQSANTSISLMTKKIQSDRLQLSVLLLCLFRLRLLRE